MATAKKIGNSLWVLIPAAMAKEFHLADGVPISIVAAGNGIQIKKKPMALDAAWVSANVSYKNGPSVDEMGQILASGKVPIKYVVHVNHLLTEMPRKLLEAAALEATSDPAMAMKNLQKIGAQIANH
jgi:antitoxin component of MazEF toxin-antitoxin module